MTISIVLLLFFIIIVSVVVLILISKGGSSERENKIQKLKSDIRTLRPLAASDDPSKRRDAMIKGDSLFSKAMQLKQYNSSSAGENLKELRGRFDKNFYNQIWEAHKKRNRIVHDNEEITQEDAKRSLSIFIKAVDKLI